MISCLIFIVLFLSQISLEEAYKLLLPTYSSPSSCRLYGNKGFGFLKKDNAFQYTGKLRPGTISPMRKVPNSIRKPSYAIDGNVPYSKNRVLAPTPPEDIAKMRQAGRYAREILDIAVQAVHIGMTTDEIDALVHEECIKRQCYPSPLNYHGYPKSVCTSINEIICHGIPDSTKLQDGDILNIDVTVFHDGVHGDCSETVLVGQVDDKVKELVYTTYQAWKAAINVCKPGAKFSDIGGVIEDVISAKGYTSVKEFCGHGINSAFHTPPNILHYRNSDDRIMEVGHTFTIEPMICMGTNKYVMWSDKWTAATLDGLPTAQFEHTLLITENGVEELTGKLPTSPKYFWEV